MGESFENSSSDTQKLILEKLTPPDTLRMFIASKSMKEKFDCEDVWLEKLSHCSKKKQLSAKEKCLRKYELNQKLNPMKSDLFALAKTYPFRFLNNKNLKVY